MTLTKMISQLGRLPIVAALGFGLVTTPAISLPSSVVAQAQGPVSVADIADGLMSSVVNISTAQKVKQPGSGSFPTPQLPEGSPFQDFFNDLFPREGQPNRPNGNPRTRQSLGSGFVIDAEEGIIITNNHVIADADEITVNFSDGSKLEAELVGTDPKTDIAVLKVTPETPLTEVPFGNSDQARVGDWVMAIGNPFGLGGTVTLGIVSAVGRDISSGPYDNFIQTDASINRGNSGGPLFNMAGEVIGINTAIISPSGGSIGIGFSIPASLATGVIDQLIQFGETRRGWLGVRIQSVTEEIAESLGLDKPKGALVSGVFDDGPAQSGGIESGDVILKFDGQEVESSRALPGIVANTPVEKAVKVEVWRKRESKTVDVTLGRLEDGEKQIASVSTNKEDDKPQTSSILGMKLIELTPEAREEAKLSENIKGLLIMDVEGGSPAADKGIQAGQVIVQINQETVTKLSDAQAQIDKLKKEERKFVSLLIESANADPRFVAVLIE